MMMETREEKRKRLMKIYELEYLVNKEILSYLEKKKIKELRKELNLNLEESETKFGKPKGAKRFDIQEYLDAKEMYPKLTDNEICIIIDVSPNTLQRAKKQAGLCKTQNTSALRFKRIEQVVRMMKEDPTLSKVEIATIFGVTPTCINKDLKEYEELKNKHKKSS